MYNLKAHMYIIPKTAPQNKMLQLHNIGYPCKCTIYVQIFEGHKFHESKLLTTLFSRMLKLRLYNIYYQ